MKKLLYIVPILFLMFACSTTKEMGKPGTALVDTDNKIDNIEIDKINCWVNMMPGPNYNPKFNISGEITISKSDNYSLNDLRLYIINVYQDGLFLYSIAPTVQIKKSSEDYKKLVFSTIKGLLLKDKFNANKSIDVRLIFKDGDDLFFYPADNLKVEKAM